MLNMELENRIVKELEKTGFPTEIVAASLMLARGWGVAHNPSYLDDLEHRSREFDIRAYRTKRKVIATRNYSVGIYLMTECKKSEKPWVFFTTPEPYLEEPLGQVIHWSLGNRQPFTNRTNFSAFISDSTLKGFHHYFTRDRLARTFYEAFKNNEKTGSSQVIYSAVMAAIKASLFLENEPAEQTWLRIFYPLVVFSGDLFEAEVGRDKEITLSRSRHVQLSFSYSVPRLRDDEISEISEFIEDEFVIERAFTVDIVHEEYLDAFLEVIEKEHQIIADYAFGAFEDPGTRLVSL